MIPKIRNIFINLPVENVSRSITFFTALDFEFNQLLTDQHVSCLTLKEGVYVNLIEQTYFKEITHNDVPNKYTQTEMMLTLVATSKERLSEFLNKAIELGAIEVNTKNDMDGVYCRRFMDLDGHLWEMLYYDQTLLFFE